MPEESLFDAIFFAINCFQKGGTLLVVQPKFTSNFINYFFSRAELFDHSITFQ